MKKILVSVATVLFAASVWAQTPEKMSYQAVVRDGGSKLITNHAVGMRVSILQGSETGTVVYTETQTTSTNTNGLVSVAIGSGVSTLGKFADIDWSKGVYYIKTEIDPTGGTDYSIVGASQLLSVPYALYAKNAGVAGIKGDKGDTGAAGKDGADGKSAYQIWLAAGNTGTEDQFLASLKASSETYTAGTGISITGTSITNASPNAIHTGDVTGATTLTIANNAVTTEKIADGTIAATDLSAMGAIEGQTLKYDGTKWTNTKLIDTMYVINKVKWKDSSTIYIGKNAGSRNIPELIAIGSYAGSGISTGIGEVIAIGNSASSGSSGGGQIAIGGTAGNSNSGFNQYVIGSEAGGLNSGDNQKAFGYQSGVANKGVNQLALGDSAGQYNRGKYQIAIGNLAGSGSGLNYNSGSHQNAIGYKAGYENKGNYTVFIGYERGKNNAIDGKIEIDPTNTTTPLIDGYAIQDSLAINGKLTATNVSGYNNNKHGLFTPYSFVDKKYVDSIVVSGGSVTSLSSGKILVGNANNKANEVSISGDVTLASTGAMTLTNGAITSAKIADGTITAADLSAMGATSDQILKWNGTTWAPSTLSPPSELLATNVSGYNNNKHGLFTNYSFVDKKYVDSISSLSANSDSIYALHNKIYIGSNAGAARGADPYGMEQIAIGLNAGKKNVSFPLIAIGSNAGFNSTGNGQLAIGLGAGQKNSGTLQIAIGREAGNQNNGANQIAIGDKAGNNDSAAYQIAIGAETGINNKGGYQNAIGHNAGQNNTGNTQNAIGFTAGNGNSGAIQNAIGYAAGQANKGDYQNAVGENAGQYNTGAYQNAFGHTAGFSNIGMYQSAVGHEAGANNSGDKQSALGYNAGRSNAGQNQIAIGEYAGAGNAGKFETAIGFSTGQGNQADSTIFIGYQRGNGNTIPGKIEIDPTNTTKPLIDGYAVGDSLIINGDLKVTKRLMVDPTIASTTGAIAINKIAGRVKIAAGYTSIVVTNNMVTANSIIVATAASNNNTVTIKSVVATNGNFTIHLTGSCTAVLDVNFIIMN